MVFSEDSRVKIPCILHLVRLGYRYLSLKDATWDEETNIFPALFSEAIARINPELGAGDLTRLLADVKPLLDNEDLGKAFFDRLTEHSGIRLIDFENFDNNSFHIVTELTCKNGDDEFRPDIALLINGMPLAFIEVKKPSNREGVLAERNRIITRSRNPKFRRFITGKARPTARSTNTTCPSPTTIARSSNWRRCSGLSLPISTWPNSRPRAAYP